LGLRLDLGDADLDLGLCDRAHGVVDNDRHEIFHADGDPCEFGLPDELGRDDDRRREVDLFPALGKLPVTLADVREREKDIRFSSRTRLNTDLEVNRHMIARAARRLVSKLPPALRGDPDAQALARLPRECHGTDIVHLIYRSKNHEGDGKEYEFSRLSMQEHWRAGYVDMTRTLQDPRWLTRERGAHGVRAFDLTPDQPVSETTTR
jgi:NTE family protein